MGPRIAACLSGVLVLAAPVFAQEAQQRPDVFDLYPLFERLGISETVVRSLDLEVGYAFLPAPDQLLNPDLSDRGKTYDLWGEAVDGPAPGAVAVNAETLALGQDAFYRETFGNEWFFSDILGLVSGPIGIREVAEAVLALNGEPTDNLRVRLNADAEVAGQQFREGEVIDTGLDVPAGALAPLGVRISYSNGEMRAGVTCALCHSAVDPESGKVVHGAINPNLELGLLLALAPNTAAYFTHAEVGDLEALLVHDGPSVPTSEGAQAPLPDPEELERRVDEILMSWPPGSFDSSLDLTANPTVVPDSFTFGEQPFGWTGFALIGPFNGLSVLNNAVHAVNSDPLSQVPLSRELFGMDPEVYIATLLRNAANPRFRYDYESGRLPSEVLAEADPLPGQPGVNDIVRLPTWPQPSLLSFDGSIISKIGSRVWESTNAMSAFQDGIIAPPAPIEVGAATREHGRRIFEEAGCVACHAGERLTDNRIRPVSEVGTNPARAGALAGLGELDLAPSRIWSFDTPVPIPPEAATLDVPSEHVDEEQLALAWALDGSGGGYKTPGLIGLWWTPPYLHDGGVAVGPDSQTDLGVPGTLLKGLRPDPRNSLRAMIDRELRQQVVAANRGEERLSRINVEGSGHGFWVDAENDFSQEDQDALIDYLLSLSD